MHVDMQMIGSVARGRVCTIHGFNVQIMGYIKRGVKDGRRSCVREEESERGIFGTNILEGGQIELSYKMRMGADAIPGDHLEILAELEEDVAAVLVGVDADAIHGED